jgi:hypothetical protein
VRRARRALARVAGALLLVGLLAAAAHLVAPERRVGAGALGSALRLHHLPQEVLIHLGREHRVVELELAHALPVEVFHFGLHLRPLDFFVRS